MEILEFEILPHDNPLFGFVGEQVGTKGCIRLYTKFEHDGPLKKGLKRRYVIVHAHTSYNILLGHPSLNALGVIVSTPHLAMKFPLDNRTVITVHAD